MIDTHKYPPKTLRIAGDEFEHVTRLCYVGSSIIPKRQMKTELTHRISQA